MVSVHDCNEFVQNMEENTRTWRVDLISVVIWDHNSYCVIVRSYLSCDLGSQLFSSCHRAITSLTWVQVAQAHKQAYKHFPWIGLNDKRECNISMRQYQNRLGWAKHKELQLKWSHSRHFLSAHDHDLYHLHWNSMVILLIMLTCFFVNHHHTHGNSG